MSLRVNDPLIGPLWLKINDSFKPTYAISQRLNDLISTDFKQLRQLIKEFNPNQLKKYTNKDLSELKELLNEYFNGLTSIKLLNQNELRLFFNESIELTAELKGCFLCVTNAYFYKK